MGARSSWTPSARLPLAAFPWVTLRDVANWAVSAPRVHREKKLTVTQTELEAALEAVRAVESLLSTGGVSFDGNSKVVTTTANKRRRV